MIRSHTKKQQDVHTEGFSFHKTPCVPGGKLQSPLCRLSRQAGHVGETQSPVHTDTEGKWPWITAMSKSDLLFIRSPYPKNALREMSRIKLDQISIHHEPDKLIYTFSHALMFSGFPRLVLLRCLWICFLTPHPKYDGGKSHNKTI